MFMQPSETLKHNCIVDTKAWLVVFLSVTANSIVVRIFFKATI